MTELLDVNKPDVVVADQTATDVTTDTATETTAQTSADKWYGETHAKVVENKGWKSLDDVLNGYEKLEKLQGMPEFAKYMSDIPETVDGYKHEYKGEGESPINEELKKGFFEWAHAKGYPNSIMSDVIDWQIDAIDAGNKEDYGQA